MVDVQPRSWGKPYASNLVIVPSMPQTSLGASQREYEELLFETGEYGNKSEIHRVALSQLWNHLPPEKRVHAAVARYKAGLASISKASVLAGVPYFEMKKILADEGALNLGFDAISKSRVAGKKFQDA